MRRLKSRNFILTVCAILISMILGVTSFYSALLISQEYTEEEQIEQVLNNVEHVSSRIKLRGGGNFNGNSPSVADTDIINFNTRLSRYGDKVEYTVEFCNKNDVDVIFVGLLGDDIMCVDSLGNAKVCNGVNVTSKVLKDDEVIQNGDKIGVNRCVDVVLVSEYVDVNLSEEIYVYGSKYSLQLEVIEK